MALNCDLLFGCMNVLFMLNFMGMFIFYKNKRNKMLKKRPKRTTKYYLQKLALICTTDELMTNEQLLLQPALGLQTLRPLSTSL